MGWGVTKFLQVVGGVLVTFFGIMMSYLGGKMPMIFTAAPIFMLMGLIMMVLGVFVIYKARPREEELTAQEFTGE
jgi:hypothetical protein